MKIQSEKSPRAPRKKARVKRGHAQLTVFPCVVHGVTKWRYAYKDGAKWRQKTFDTKQQAEESAWDHLGELGTELVWETLPDAEKRFLAAVHRGASHAHDRTAVLEFLNSRNKSAKLDECVKRFKEHQVAEAGEETRHLANVRREIDRFAKAYPDKMLVDLHAPAVRKWWEDRTKDLSAKTKNEVRGVLVQFWKWAVWDGIVPVGVSPADKLPLLALGNQERRVLTPDEMRAVLLAAGEEFRALFVLGAFAGFRPEELAPPKRKGMKSKASKRGLLCEEIDWKFNVIRVPAEVSKTARPRIVPLLPACRAWLEWAGVKEGDKGPVCSVNASEAGETKRLGTEVLGGEWPQDAVRHSFGSYRNAIVRSLHQVAEEMGTSIEMMHKHYHNPRATDEGEEWFALRPKPIKSDTKKRGSWQEMHRKRVG